MKKQKPKISIVIPVYNSENFVVHCLDSIKKQSFTDYECIIIDDGSQDESGRLCDEFVQLDSRFCCFHQKNMGPSVARNLGLKKAIGEKIIFIDSDDWCEPNYLSELYECAVITGADIVGCDLFLEYRKKCRVYKCFMSTDKQENISNLVNNKLPGWSPIKLVSTSLYRDYNIEWPTNIRICEDVLVSLELFCCANFMSYVNTPLYHYNLTNDNSLSKHFTEEKCKQLIEVDRKIKEILQINNIYHKNKNHLLERNYFTWSWLMIDSNSRLRKKYSNLYTNYIISEKGIKGIVNGFMLWAYRHKLYVLGEFIVSCKKLSRLVLCLI